MKDAALDQYLIGPVLERLYWAGVPNVNCPELDSLKAALQAYIDACRRAQQAATS